MPPSTSSRAAASGNDDGASKPSSQANHATAPVSHSQGSFWDGFAGTTNGSFFKCPRWVNQLLPPGHTAQTPGTWPKFANEVFRLKHFIWSPNFVWFVVAVVMYIFFPYDIEGAKAPQTVDFWITMFLYRATANMTMVFLYYAFWEVTLYHARWSSRKFKGNVSLSASNLAHNVGYTALGVLQWTCWELIFVKIWASGNIPYITDGQAFSSASNVLRTVGWAIGVPVWRTFHFYFAHRLIHLNVLYKYVHSLHHRNKDVEPFAGLAMHPLEHVYYFACICPSLFFLMSPFHFMWNGVHLLISPAASHSGYEDHFQSDQFHYIHHALFECNYGNSSFPLDHYFGTFREKLGSSRLYRGEGKAKVDAVADSAMAKKEKKMVQTLKPTVPPYFHEFMAFTSFTFIVLGLACYGLEPLSSCPRIMACFLTLGPIAFGTLLWQMSSDKQALIWPFHKDSLGNLSIHVGVGFLISVMPVYWTVEALLGDSSVYCQIWGCWH